MPFTLTMPKLSPTMEEGQIVKWHKKEGDLVKSGDLLIEVATDKATVEYNALDDGYLRKILIEEGKNASVNQAVAIFTEKKEESIEGYTPEGRASHQPEKEVKAEAKEAPAKPSQKPAEIAATSQPSFAPEPPIENYSFPFPEHSTGRVKASPLAKKLAAEKGVDIRSVKGTGPGSRVTSRDLNLAQPSRAIGFGKKEIPDIPPGTYEEIPLSPMRKIIGTRLQQAKTYIPHIYIRQEIDAEPMILLREQLKKTDIKVSFNDFVVRAVALSLREHPNVNSGFHAANQTILAFKTIDISIAVSMEQGLITPIIRHADYKDLGQISVEVKELAARAKLGKLEPHEYKGGSFTISNMGMMGINDFSAIINPPQAAILAVGAIHEAPVVKQGSVVAGQLMNLTLSCDHRVIDGADGARFLLTLQKYLENPTALLL